MTKNSGADDGTFIKIPSSVRKEAYIIPASDPVKDADLSFRYPHHSRWTPTAFQCVEADLAIKLWIDDQFQRELLSRVYRSKGFIQNTVEETPIGMIHRLYSKYGCQFIGIIVSPDKLIFANYYLLEDGSHDGERGFMFICDGGPISWQIQYDVNTKTCSLVLIGSYLLSN